ncbi:MAG TPA: POTRA domain-containing protein, partial [Candidatus Paceibacterota bacterium]|nr:POTRA domain-containing protein [Candidatus Paceibacterota bacterium]
RALLLPGWETNSIPETTGRTFAVKGYEVTGNTLLTKETLDLIFEPYVGTNVSLGAIQAGLKDLQAVYRDRGFPTVSVALPQQTLSDGVVKVNAFEGRLSEILVVNNHYFSSNNVMRALPGLRTNMILTGPIFQAELDRANANQDRQIYPQIEPGLEENTTALRLKVNDRLPLHGKVELNNQSSPGTPEMRVNSSAVYNNLWQHEHSLGLQYSFSPELFKSGNQWAPYDVPLVANYSGFYRMPLGDPDPIADIIAARPGNFGYDEATRRFNLPPPSGRPELNLYASRSVIDTGVMTIFNDYVYNFGTNWLTQHDVQRDLTENDTFGARLTIPLLDANKSASFSGGFDYKIYDLVSHKTNIAILGEITGLPEGPVTNYYPNVVPSANSHHLEYLPLSIRYDAVWRDARGTTAFGVGMAANAWHSGSISNLQSITGSAKSQGHWLVLTPSLTRDFIFHTNWTVSLHTEAQWANEPLISNEKFGVGGMANVRGYKEGEAFGDNGWRVNLDLKTPPHTVGTVFGKELLTVRGSFYMDYAETYLLEVPKGVDGFVPLWGTGAGAVISVGSHWDARLLFSVPLLKTASTTPGQPRFNFSITGQF